MSEIAPSQSLRTTPQMAALLMPCDRLPDWQAAYQAIADLSDADLERDIALHMLSLDTRESEEDSLAALQDLLRFELRLLASWIESGVLVKTDLAGPSREERLHCWVAGGLSDGCFVSGHVEAISLLSRTPALANAGFDVVLHNAAGIN